MSEILKLSGINVQKVFRLKTLLTLNLFNRVKFQLLYDTMDFILSYFRKMVLLMVIVLLPCFLKILSFLIIICLENTLKKLNYKLKTTALFSEKLVPHPTF